MVCVEGGHGRAVLERRQPQRRLGRRLEEVVEAVGGGLLSVTDAVEPWC